MTETICMNNQNDERLWPYFVQSEIRLLRCNEPHPGLFIAESAKVINRALDADYEPVSALIRPDQIDCEIEDTIKRLSDNPHLNIPVYSVTANITNLIKGFNLTRGILCAMKRKPLTDIGSVIGETRSQNRSRIVVLEDVENPTNMGAIIRSAAAMGADAMLFTSDSCDPLYKRSIRVSMGNVFQIPWTIVDKQSYPTLLKKAGYKLVSLALKKDSLSIDNPRIKEEDHLAIILGNEGNGLCQNTLACTDFTVMIPMSHGVDSLNVAATSAIAFWELCMPR